MGIRISVTGKGEGQGEIFKHLAPITVGQLLRVLPIRGRAVKPGGSLLYVPTGLALGVEKGKTSFRRGEVALFPANGAICFFLADSNVGRPMNPLGKVTEGIGVLEQVDQGDTILISAS